MGWISCLTRLHGTNFCTTSARFAPSFVRQPNGTKCTQIVRNASKHEFRSQRVQSGVFIAKNYDATLWHKLLHLFGPLCTEFRKATKRSQMHPNSTERTKTSVQGPIRWIACICCKNSDATSWHELLHQFALFCTEFRKSTKRSPMHQNCTKCSRK